MYDAEPPAPSASPGTAPEPLRAARRPTDTIVRDAPVGKRRGRRRTRHTVAKVLLSSLVALVLVTGLSAAYLYRHLNGNLHVYDATQDMVGDRPERVFTGPDGPLNIVVIGSDSRV